MTEKLQFYTCPMHANVVQEQEGLCSECGMKLVLGGKKKQGDDDDHHGHAAGNLFIFRFWVSALLSIPIIAYSGLLQRFFGWSPSVFGGSAFVMLGLGTVVFFYGGWVFLVGGWREVRGRSPGMMALIALAIVVAYSYSVFEIITQAGQGLLWELSTLIAIMLLGHWMEMRAVRGVQGALGELAKLLPDTTEVIRGGERVTVSVTELRVGDMVFVRPGGAIPVDGIIVEGRSSIDEALVTGESRPVTKKKGDAVVAGTINSDGALTVEVQKIGDETFLAGVQKLVAEAQRSKSRLHKLSDRAAFYLTFIAIGSGVLTFVAWLLVRGGIAVALERTVAVLVIACPHALGLAIPLVAVISTTMAARKGFLVRDRLALEQARLVDVVLFDKTGTLTKGEYGVTDIWPVAAENEEEVLRLAASVDQQSEHFISRAIVAAAKERGTTPFFVTDFVRLAGRGVKGVVGGQPVYVGGWRILEEGTASFPHDLQKAVRNESKKGKTIIIVHNGSDILGVLGLADVIRDESRDAIMHLKEMGIRVAMVTGDSEEVASWVAEELKIDEYFAGVLPQEKSEKVKLLQKRGKKVAMVGDGINDAPALTQADIGIAVGAGTNVAIESAGVILAENDPRDVVGIVRLSRATYRKMIQNLFWAAGYNVLAIPLAAGVLASKGIVLQPALGAFLMSLSTVIVAANAMLLKKSAASY